MKYIFNLLFITIAILLIFAIYKNIEATKDNTIKAKEINKTKTTIQEILNKDKNKTATQKHTKEDNNKTTTKLTKKEQNKKTKLTKEQIDIEKAKRDRLQKRLKELKAKVGDALFLRIFKKSKELEVWIKPKESKEYKLLKIYKICNYSGETVQKLP